MSSGESHSPDPEPDPAGVTDDRLADLQAGLLDDARAARVRRHVRGDQDAARTLAGLAAVRRELAQLGAGAGPAPAVPADVTARITAALREAPHPTTAGAHLAVRPRLTRMQRAGLLVGVTAAAVAVVVGALTLLRGPETSLSADSPTASQITVAGPPRSFPLTDAQVRAELTAPADLGPLADPRRRGPCLAGLGYAPTLDVLGGRQLDVWGRPGILLVLPGAVPEQIAAVAVAPSCNAVDTGLIAEIVVSRR